MSGATTAEGLAPTTQNAAVEVAIKQKVSLGIAPQTLDEGWRLAQLMAQSSLVPKDFQNRPADVLVAIELGMEVGFAPMQALQSIAVINGRPSIWGDGFLALIMASPVYQDHDEFYEVDGTRVSGLTLEDLKKPTTAAVCIFVRKGKELAVTRRFSVAQATKAGLLGKQGPWSTYPDRMLLMRARSWAGRDTFPDVLRGIRTAEEAHDEPASVTTVQVQPRRLGEAAPAVSTSAPAVPETKTPQRASETTPTGQATTAAPTREPLVSDPCTIVKVTEQKKKGTDPVFWIETSDTQSYSTLSSTEAAELTSFEGTDHQVRITYVEEQARGKTDRHFVSVAIVESTAAPAAASSPSPATGPQQPELTDADFGDFGR